MIHYLKIKPEFLHRIEQGDKTFEIRKNDRDYQNGDFLVLTPTNISEEISNLASFQRTMRVTYILHGGVYGLDQDYCVMSISPYDKLRDRQAWDQDLAMRRVTGRDI